MPLISRVFEFYNPYSTKNAHTTQASITMPQMVNGMTPPPVLTLYSEKQTGMSFYAPRYSQYTVTYCVGGAFIGDCMLQYSNTPSPGDGDWIDIPGTLKSYIGLETTGGAGISGGFSSAISHPVQTDAVVFVGDYFWLRARLNISQGSLLSMRYNF